MTCFAPCLEAQHCPITLGSTPDTYIEDSVYKLDFPWKIYSEDKALLFTLEEKFIDLDDSEYADLNLWIYENVVDSHVLRKSNAIYIKRVGDSDKVYLNDCLIGSTGLKNDNEPYGWFTLHSSLYSYDTSCIREGANKVKIYTYKVSGAVYGIYSGYVGLGKYNKLLNQFKTNNYLRFGTLLFYGLCILFFICPYYFYIFLISGMSNSDMYFCLFSFSISIFLILTSAYPFHMDIGVTLLSKVLFSSGLMSGIFLLQFFNSKFSLISQKLINALNALSVAIFLPALFSSDVMKVYYYYEVWFSIYILFLLIFILNASYKKFIGVAKIHNKYFIALIFIAVCVVHDVFVTKYALSNPYLIGYGFVFVLGASALTLAREYANSLTYYKQKTELEVKYQQEKMLFELSEQVSHDIQSPLSALKVIHRKAIKKLDHDTEKLLNHVVQRIENIAGRIKRAKVTDITDPSMRPIVDIHELATKVIQEKVVEYAGQNVHIEYSKDSNQSIIPIEIKKLSDEYELEVLLSNLINNAIESYESSQHKQVHVNVHVGEKLIELVVKDFGKGMDEEVLTKVFDQYYSSEKKDGTGIGLYHAKKLADSCNWILNFKSKPGEGTAVIIGIPK